VDFRRRETMRIRSVAMILAAGVAFSTGAQAQVEIQW
jgi:hypothetical protein